MFKKGDSSKRTLISSQGREWLQFSAPGWEEREEAEDSLCLRPSFTEYQCFLPPGHKHRPGDFCVYTSISTLCRCTTGKGLCAHIGGLSSTSNLIPRVAPGPPRVPAVLLQASFRQAVLWLPSGAAAALWIHFHQYIIHLFIYCLSKRIVW